MHVTRRLEESVFGLAGNIGTEAGTFVFFGLIVGLVFLEVIFAKAEEWAKEHESNELFEKLKKELTMMGILSFTVFIYQTAYANSENEYYMAFEMSHIVILFIAIAFIIQASFLLQFAFKEGKHFLLAQRTTASDLLDMYKVMNKESPWATWFFNKSPFWVPAFPAFRNDIENKLIEKLFLMKHKLPEEFRFAHYMSKLFSNYISELGEVSPVSWCLLGILVLFNWARIAAVDSTYEPRLCPREEEGEEEEEGEGRRLLGKIFLGHLAHNLNKGVRRALNEEESEEGAEEEFHPVCYEFIFEYSFVIIINLGLVMICVYLASAWYHQTMLKALLDEEGLEWDNTKGRELYIEVLKCMAEDEDEVRSASKEGTSRHPSVLPGRKGSYVGRDRSGTLNSVSSVVENPVVSKVKPAEESKVFVDKKTEQAQVQELAVRSAAPTTPTRKPSKRYSLGMYSKKTMEVMRQEQSALLDEAKHKEEEEKELKKRGVTARVKATLYKLFYGEQGEGHLDGIFFLSNPNLFFGAVEFTLLMQCLYIAMWATQLVPLLTQSDEKVKAIAWGFGLTVPMIVNFLIIRLILSRSVMLQAVCGVHPQVLGEVTEEAIEEDHCLERLRKAVRCRLEAEAEATRMAALSPEDAMVDEGAPEIAQHEKVASYKVHLKRIFDSYDDDSSGAIGEKEFVTMLNDLCVYFSKSSFKILWLAIDFDLSGEVSWDELFVIMFPELKAEMKRELAIVNKLREALGNKFIEMKLANKEDQLAYMRTVFETYDADKSGTIDVDEMEGLVMEYIPDMDSKGTEQLFAAIDIDGEGGIEWSEFSDIFFGIDSVQEKKNLKWF